MPYVFYRADARAPNEIRDAGGFQARVPLETAQARALVTRFTNSIDPISLPKLAGNLQNDINNKGQLKLLDLSTTIKRETNYSSIHISTDITEDSGGRSAGHIYKIEYDSLYAGSSGMVLFNNPDSLEASPLKPLLVIDTESLDTASTIGVSCTGNEVFFLTSIPYSKIKQYKTGNTWHDMPPA